MKAQTFHHANNITFPKKIKKSSERNQNPSR
jgi:hypothetical protein